MTDAEALLAAIIAEPAEDAPRLAYADWLTDNEEQVECGRCRGKGEHSGFLYVKCEDCSGTGRVSNGNAARAEFIRVQCELARMEDRFKHVGGLAPPKSDCSCIGCTLRHRERELLGRASTMAWAEDGQKWLPESWPLDAGRDGNRLRWDWTRGFVSKMSLPWTDWRTHADAILKAQPVEKVRLKTWPDVNVEMDAEDFAMSGMVMGMAIIKCALGKLWPGIAFELPAEGPIQGRRAAIYFDEFVDAPPISEELT